VYVREEVGGLVVGGYERNPDPWHVDTPIPQDFNHRLLQERWPRFEAIAEGAFALIPSLQSVEVNRFINGPRGATRTMTSSCRVRGRGGGGLAPTASPEGRVGRHCRMDRRR
jgi:glycine/D-amino acid oxidase-like deaminating enzyme